MASTGINVLRWSTLFFGIFYGFSHQRTIYSQQEERKLQQKYHEEETLIAQAKAEYLKKTKPQVVEQDGGVITDPNDPKFDLEAYLKMSEVDEVKAKH